MKRSVWAIAALFYIAGMLTIIVAEQLIDLARFKPAFARVASPISPNDGPTAIAEARVAIQSNLRDPASAQFYDEVVLGPAARRIVCGNVNAKNGFGGYTGKSAFIYNQQSRFAWAASNHDEATSIDQLCKQARADDLKAEISRLCKQEPDNSNPACEKYR